MIRKFALVLLAVCGAAFAANDAFELNVANVPNGSIQYSGNGFASATSIYAGQTVNVSYFPATGYVLENVKAYKTADTTQEITLQEVSGNKYSFTMPSAAVTITGTFKKGSYNVTVNGCTLLTCPAVSVHEFGSQVSFTITQPSSVSGSYDMDVNGIGDSNAVSKVKQGDNRVYTFTMPGNDVTFNVRENLTVKPTRYKIALNGCENLNCSAPDSANVGDEVTIKIFNTEAYRASNISIVGFDEDDVISKVDNTDTTIYVVAMPSNDVTFTVTAEKQQYTVYVATDVSNGTISLKNETNQLSAIKDFGSKVSFTVSPDKNYKIDFVKVVKADDASVTVKTSETNGVYTYKVPGYHTIVTAAFKKTSSSSSGEDEPEDPQPGSSSSSSKKGSSSSGNGSSEEETGYYYVNISKSDNGIVEKGGSFAKDYPNATREGNEIRLRAYPETGYELSSLKVVDADGNEVKLSKDEDEYKFTMPASDVTVKAKFKVADYDITVKGCGGLKCDYPKTAKMGDEVKVTIALTTGYSGFTLSAKGLPSINKKDSGLYTYLTFSMPSNDVEISVVPQEKAGAKSSSSGKDDDNDKSSSSGKSGKSSSSKGKGKGDKDAIHVSAQLPQFSVITADRQILVSGVPAGADYFLLDVNGRVMFQGCTVAQDFAITVPRSGNFLLRVGRSVRSVNVK